MSRKDEEATRFTPGSALPFRSTGEAETQVHVLTPRASRLGKQPEQRPDFSTKRPVRRLKKGGGAYPVTRYPSEENTSAGIIIDQNEHTYVPQKAKSARRGKTLGIFLTLLALVSAAGYGIHQATNGGVNTNNTYPPYGDTSPATSQNENLNNFQETTVDGISAYIVKPSKEFTDNKGRLTEVMSAELMQNQTLAIVIQGGYEQVGVGGDEQQLEIEESKTWYPNDQMGYIPEVVLTENTGSNPVTVSWAIRVKNGGNPIKGEYLAYIFNTTSPTVIGIPGTDGSSGTLVPYFGAIKGPNETTPYQGSKVVIQTVSSILN